MKKERSSNLELLRIVAMLMIAVYHIWCHSVNVQLGSAESIAKMNNGWFNAPVFSKKLLLLQTIAPFGKIGNAIFILISGYFLVSKGQNIDLGKTARKLTFQMGFVTVLLMVSSAAFFMHFPDLSIEMTEINSFNSLFWFAGYYFAITVCAFLFLNRWLAKLSRKQYQTFLWVAFALTQMQWVARVIDGLTGWSGLIVLLAGIFLYSMGGYIQKYDPLRGIRTGWLLLAIGLIYLLIYLADYNATQNTIQRYLGGTSDLFKQDIIEFGDHYFVPIALGILVFEIFQRMHIRNSKMINSVAQAMFMTYLVHDNPFFYSLWNTQDWVTLLYKSPMLFTGKILLWALAALGIGIITYALYAKIEKALTRWLAARRAGETE